MNNFRDNHPVQRSNPRSVRHYRDYKRDLQEDFHARCGYCNDADHWSGGWRFYQLDHYIPKKYLLTISENDYSNLVYSCFYCNNAKRAKWPSKDESIILVGEDGIINPREVDYAGHLMRDDRGNIVAITNTGRYMMRAMKLGLMRHAIIWNLDRIESVVEVLISEYEAVKSKLPDQLNKEIASFFVEYYQYQKQLRKEQNA